MKKGSEISVSVAKEKLNSKKSVEKKNKHYIAEKKNNKVKKEKKENIFKRILKYFKGVGKELDGLMGKI